MNNKKTLIGILVIVLLGCIAMYFIEVRDNFDYFQKSFIKIIFFAILPVLYCIFNKNINLKDFLRIKSKKQVLISLLLGIVLYIIIILSYIIFSEFIELNEISNTLTTDLNINGGNFIYIAIYISLINSFLEEFFFRGFSFFSLSKLISKKFAYIFSSLAFSLYHVSMIAGWFNIYIFVLIIIGLFIGGLIFNYLNEKYENIYNSWLVHMFANFAINSIGIYMFYYLI